MGAGEQRRGKRSPFGPHLGAKRRQLRQRSVGAKLELEQPLHRHGDDALVQLDDDGTLLSLQDTAVASTSTGKVLSISDTTTGAGYGVYSAMTGLGNTGYAGYFTNIDTGADANYGVYASNASASGYAGYFTSSGNGAQTLTVAPASAPAVYLGTSCAKHIVRRHFGGKQWPRGLHSL